MRRPTPRLVAIAIVLFLIAPSARTFARGDMGHRIVARVATDVGAAIARDPARSSLVG